MAATGGHGVIRFDEDEQVWPPTTVTNIPNYKVKSILIDDPGVGTYSLRLGSGTGDIIWSATFPAGGDGLPKVFEVCTAQSGGQRLYWDGSLGASAVAYLYVGE